MRELNEDVRRTVARAGTNWVDGDKKACNSRSLEIKVANLNARIESTGGKRV